MAVTVATRRIERFSGTPTCKYWLAGRCNRNPCRFLHRLPSPSAQYHHNANTHSNKYIRKPHSPVKKTIKDESKEVKPPSTVEKTIKDESKNDAVEVSDTETGNATYETNLDEASPKPSKSICKYWMNDNCVHGDKCQDLHSWSYGDRISTIAKLHEHKKVWDHATFDCKMTLGGHTQTVTSLICWADYLLSSSLDCTLNLWVMTEEGALKVECTHTEETGIVALGGMNESKGKHILFISCKDNSVRMYELPTFTEMGQIFARQEVRSFEMGPSGLFFTGDGTGLLSVWKWSD